MSTETSNNITENTTNVEDTTNTIESNANVKNSNESTIEIPTQDYSKLSQDELYKELDKIIKKYPIQLLKTEVEKIREAFNKQFDEAALKSKESFLEEGGNPIDFYYSTPLRKKFNELYFNYKSKKEQYYSQIRSNHHNNLKNRLELIK